jgi:hypothetical protein
MLTDIGKCDFDQSYGKKEIEEAIRYLIEL